MRTLERVRPVTMLLVVALAIVPFFGWWPPDWYEPDEGLESHTPLGSLIAGFLWPLLPLVVLAFASATAACGLAAQGSGLRYLAGCPREDDFRPARDWLTASARTTVATGFLFGLTALGLLFLVMKRQASPADLAEALSMTIAWPLFALAIGRAVLAPAARAAAIRAGEPERRLFSPLEDLALFVLILPPGLGIFSTIMKF